MLDKTLNSKKGFTLIELMIVVVIIGILAAMAIPRFMRTSTKAKQSEAKKILKQIYVCERTYRQENDAYACNGQTASAGGGFPEIWIEIMQNARYTYSITADSNTFNAIASGNIDDDDYEDKWSIDHTGFLDNLKNDVTNQP